MFNSEPTIINALNSLYPEAIWTLRGNDLDWHDENKLPPPTEEEIYQEIERLKGEYEYNQYQRDRASEYPSIQDQLDILYHQGYDGWKAIIDEVKNKYPKPGED
jgi:hypothetical protein